MELQGIRPAVISRETQNELIEYLRFRHLFRNLYGFELKTKQLKELQKQIKPVYRLFKQDINKFIRFLQKVAK